MKAIIIRDSREKEGHGWDYPEDNFCAGTKIEKLDCGDYSIEGIEGIFIDRKQSVSEIAKNFTEKRFKDLLERAKNYKYKFIICEFALSDVMKYPVDSEIPPKMWKKIRIKPKFLQLCISEIFVKYGINFIFAGNKKNAESMCYTILREIYKMETQCS